MNQKIKIVVALGANLGDRKKTILTAINRMKEDFLEKAQESSLIETEPWGIIDQPKFLNGVIVGMSAWKPPAILNYLKSLEKEFGRTESILNGPRVLDLDLICYGDQIWNSDRLQVPHPRMATRSFVLIPLMQVWPDWVHPVLQKNVGQLLALVESEIVVPI